jgi:secreted Zn-dependent insulinase-like peptidase
VIELLKEKVENLTENLLADYKTSLRNQILKPDDNLAQRFAKIWTEISSNNFEFDRKIRLLDEIDKVSVGDLKASFSQIFYKSPRKLSIQVYAGSYKIPDELQKDEPYTLNKQILAKVLKNVNALHKNELLFTSKRAITPAIRKTHLK